MPRQKKPKLKLFSPATDMLPSPMVVRFANKAGISRVSTDGKLHIKKLIVTVIGREFVPKLKPLVDYTHNKTVLPTHVRQIASKYMHIPRNFEAQNYPQCSSVYPLRPRVLPGRGAERANRPANQPATRLTAQQRKNRMNKKIRYYVEQNCFIIGKTAFRKVVKHYMRADQQNFRMSVTALVMLQSVVEKIVLDFLEVAKLNMLAAKRQTLYDTDILTAYDMMAK